MPASPPYNTVLVTGASGFAGRPLVRALRQRGLLVCAASRAHAKHQREPGDRVLPDLSQPFDAGRLLAGVDAVVHLAGLAHSSPEIPESEYMAVNCEATARLARAARAAGVRRFVFVSSVRAQCGPSAAAVVTETLLPEPSDAYGRSKRAAEEALTTELRGSDTADVVLRPVLMVGPAAKGNMATLMRLARSPWPLPLGGLPGRRSLLSMANFCDGVAHALSAPAAARGTFLLADDDALTAGEILAALRLGLGRAPRVLKLPLPGLRSALGVAGRADLAERLMGNLIVSTAAFKAAGWGPVQTAAKGLADAICPSAGDA